MCLLLSSGIFRVTRKPILEARFSSLGEILFIRRDTVQLLRQDSRVCESDDARYHASGRVQLFFIPPEVALSSGKAPQHACGRVQLSSKLDDSASTLRLERPCNLRCSELLALHSKYLFMVQSGVIAARIPSFEACEEACRKYCFAARVLRLVP